MNQASRLLIALRGAGRTYPGPPAVEALRPTDLAVRAGEHVAIVGPSGCGKSTLLNLIGLLDRPTAGVYEFDGIDVGGLSDRDCAALRGRRVGIVFQSFHLLPLHSASENVELGLLYSGVPRARRRSAAAAALERVGLGHRREAVPTTLSGGERQRVAIARALVGRPGILLCDEPTGNLDTGTAHEVLTVLDDLHAQGLTLLVITHDAAVAARADRVVTMRDGRLLGPARDSGARG